MFTWIDEMPFPEAAEVFSEEFKTVAEILDKHYPITEELENESKQLHLLARLEQAVNDGYIHTDDAINARQEIRYFIKGFQGLCSGERVMAFTSTEEALMVAKMLPMVEKARGRFTKEREAITLNFTITPDEEM